MKTTNFLAVDLGATSGRTILGMIKSGSIELREINRFPNKIIEANGHFYWDFLNLYQSILEGLKIIADEKIEIQSIGIDTWGVDFVCFDKNGEVLGNPYSYRDPHTDEAQANFFKIVPREKVYKSTGIQFMNFNSLFQLSAMKAHNSAILPLAEKILFMPDALSYMLTGETVTEYTIASTSQMLDANKQKFDIELLNAVGLTENNFGRFVFPGEVVGTLSASVQKQTGLGAIPVIAVAGHDTGSAVAAVPARDKNYAYLSSGTWSLMGIEAEKPIITDESFTLNFTNEGGVEGTIRFLKNICGMWLLERCRFEWGTTSDENSYPQLIADAKAADGFISFINPDAVDFANPVSMIKAIQHYCEKTSQVVPRTKAEITRCIFESLAFRYKQVLESLRSFASFPIESLHVIGGGSKNAMLNQFTANALGIPVYAGPMEATAIGNVMIQAKTAGLYANTQDMRTSIAESIELVEFLPESQDEWDTNYRRYLVVTKNS
ncbi:MAG: rhamnulokinase [Bacteroidetes bacterium]|nr:rhamnulokinase [Bacteroidota bacterium]